MARNLYFGFDSDVSLSAITFCNWPIERLGVLLRRECGWNLKHGRVELAVLRAIIVLVQRQVRCDWYDEMKEDKSNSLTKKDVEDGTMRLAGVIFQTCRVSQPFHAAYIDTEYIEPYHTIVHRLVCRRLLTSPPPPRSITIVAHSMANLTLPDFAAISADRSSIAIIAQERLAPSNATP